MNRSLKVIHELIISFLLITILFAKISHSVINFDLKNLKIIDFYQQVQLWGVYTHDGDSEDLLLDDGSGVYTNYNIDPVTSRLDIFLRRARIGIRGNIRDNLNYNICFAYDNLGKNEFTATPGTAQTSDNNDFYLWDAYFTWNLDPSWLNLTAGYFRPQIGRESITSSFNVTSFTKALTNTYLRQHLVGRSSGRETGVNIGGLYNLERWGINYNFGFFDTSHPDIIGYELVDGYWNPLLTARLAVSIGDPEMKKYGINYRETYTDNRDGVTIAGNYTYQGRTNQSAVVYNLENELQYMEMDGFKSNSVYGIDILANKDNMAVSLEVDKLFREYSIFDNCIITYDTEEVNNLVYHFRVSYLIGLKDDCYIQPSGMFTKYDWESSGMFKDYSEHSLLDLGINMIMNEEKTKINLHYTFQNGGRKTTFTDELISDKGNFIGLGVQFII